MTKHSTPARRTRTSGSRIARLAAALALGTAAPLAAAPAVPQPQAAAARAIDEGLFVNVNGVGQWVTIRGRDLRNPVLLVLHGGPGVGITNVAPFFTEWEKHYTIVLWDQAGGGVTYAKNMGRDVGPITVERFARDGIAVTEFVRKRLNVGKVAIFGHSWGTLLGVEMAHRRPDLFSAYIGSAQVVSGLRGTMLGYQMALEAARLRGDAAAVKALEAAPPPYTSLPAYFVRQQYAMAPGSLEAPKMQAYMRWASSPAPADAHYAPQGLPGYDWMKVFMETWGKIYQEQLTWEAEDLGLRFRMPVYIFPGAEDINTPASLAMDYCRRISAPAKACETIPGAAHNSIFFGDELLALLNKHVRPELMKHRR